MFIGILLAVIFLGMNFWGQKITVAGESMYPTLQDGDEVWIDKLSYTLGSVNRFDCVVFPHRYKEDQIAVKRVIALPGETVQIQEGMIYINGQVLSEPYSFSAIDQPGMASSLITMGVDEYFVLSDNRSDTTDSREPTIGNIRRDEIIGRALFVGWPLKRMGFVR